MDKRYIYAILGILAFLGIIWIVTMMNKPANASYSRDDDTVKACHWNGEEWKFVEHYSLPLEGTDFLYEGSNNTSTSNKNKWCNDNVPVEPTPEPTPVVTPEATPTPFDFARDATDKCVNLDGIQATIPEGMFLNDKTLCQDIIGPTQPPVKAVVATVLPKTGDNSALWYFLLGLGIVGLGITGSIYFNKKTSASTTTSTSTSVSESTSVSTKT